MKNRTQIEQLQRFLNENDIPQIKGKPKTFLGIAKQPHYENVISNIYAFYFDVNEEHGLKDLFINSLSECIASSKLGSQKEALQNFNDFNIDSEYPTNKGGRIDILLSNDDYAIIIENKVYHYLNNNLDDYWNSIKVQANNKIGIVLSLQPVSDIEHKHFINITHLELLQNIMKNCGLYLIEANNKYLVFLKDLYQNIMNLSRPIMKLEELDFYFKNKTEINQLVKFKTEVRNHIVYEIEKVGKSLDGVNLYSPRASSDLGKRVRYYQSLSNKNLVIVVFFENMLIDKTLKIVVELIGDCLVDRHRYKEVLLNEEEISILAPDFYSNKNNHWAHFAIKEYHLTEVDVANLSEFILKKLEEDKLLSIFRKLESFIQTHKQDERNQTSFRNYQKT